MQHYDTLSHHSTGQSQRQSIFVYSHWNPTLLPRVKSVSTQANPHSRKADFPLSSTLSTNSQRPQTDCARFCLAVTQARVLWSVWHQMTATVLVASSVDQHPISLTRRQRVHCPPEQLSMNPLKRIWCSPTLSVQSGWSTQQQSIHTPNGGPKYAAAIITSNHPSLSPPSCLHPPPSVSLVFI